MRNKSLAEHLAGPHDRKADLRDAERTVRSSIKRAQQRQKETGRTLLHTLPTSVFDDECVKRAVDLIEAGADIHACDAMGNTPLHVATSQGCIEYATLLVQLGASPIVANDAEDCPMELTPLGAKGAGFFALWQTAPHPAVATGALAAPPPAQQTPAAGGGAASPAQLPVASAGVGGTTASTVKPKATKV